MTVLSEPTDVYAAIRQTLAVMHGWSGSEWETSPKALDATRQVIDLLESIGAKPPKLLPHGGDAIALTWEDGPVKLYFTVNEDDLGQILRIDRTTGAVA